MNTKYRIAKYRRTTYRKQNIDSNMYIKVAKYGRDKISKDKIRSGKISNAKYQVTKYRTQNIEVVKYRAQNNGMAKHRKLKLKSPFIRISKVLYFSCQTPSGARG